MIYSKCTQLLCITMLSSGSHEDDAGILLKLNREGCWWITYIRVMNIYFNIFINIPPLNIGLYLKSVGSKNNIFRCLSGCPITLWILLMEGQMLHMTFQPSVCHVCFKYCRWCWWPTLTNKEKGQYATPPASCARRLGRGKQQRKGAGPKTNKNITNKQ